MGFWWRVRQWVYGRPPVAATAGVGLLLLVGFGGWQEYSVVNAEQVGALRKVDTTHVPLSHYLGGRPVRTQTSATASLEMALLASGIGKGDEVITPAMSFVATANVIMRVGARPVFVDVGLDSRNLDLDQVEPAITPRTRAIMPVHFAGLPVDMDRLYDIAQDLRAGDVR